MPQGRDGLLTIFFLRMEYHGRYRNQTARYRFHGSVSAYSYELLGAGEAGATILQRLLLALDPKSAGNNRDKIVDIQWLYEGSDGLLSVGMEHMKTFIVQANSL
jgi:hypothetical protein